MCLLLATIACGGSSSTPTVPSPPSLDFPQSGPFLPLPAPEPPYLSRYSVASFEGGIRSQVTDEDFVCGPGWPHYCKGFLVRAPGDGVLTLEMTWPNRSESYPLDFDVYDPEAGQVWYSYPSAAGQRRVQGLRVHAGVTYPVTVWSAYVPGSEFVLTPSLRSE